MPEHRQIALRTAVAVDEPTHRAAFAAARAGTLGDSVLPATLVDELLALQYRAMQAHYRQVWPTAEYLTIVVDSQPAGRLVVDRSPGSVRVVDIALLPQYQGRDVGGTVLDWILDDAAAVDAAVVLQVASDNPGARRLYERKGFRAVAAADEPYIAMEWRGPRLRSGDIASRTDTLGTTTGVYAP